MAANLEPQLSAISGTVDDLARRVSDLAGEQRAARRDDRVLALEEVERHLNSASRRLGRLIRDLGA